jgi:hypothetical protein
MSKAHVNDMMVKAKITTGSNGLSVLNCIGTPVRYAVTQKFVYILLDDTD